MVLPKYILNPANNNFNAVQLGISTDKPVAADYDGDGQTNIAVSRPNGGIYDILRNNSNAYDALQLGASGDLPVASAYVPRIFLRRLIEKDAEAKRFRVFLFH